MDCAVLAAVPWPYSPPVVVYITCCHRLALKLVLYYLLIKTLRPVIMLIVSIVRECFVVVEPLEVREFNAFVVIMVFVVVLI